jgi:hypothetical protein
MEMKWFAIMMVGIVVAMSGSVAVSKHSERNCIASFAMSDRTADEIEKICH